jgi:hypothetical protein
MTTDPSKAVRLTKRQQAFVHAYIGAANGNATKAAIAAGYSEKAARQAGQQVLTSTAVQAAIQTRTEQVPMTADEALEQVASIARADVQKVNAADKLRANELILKAKGALRDKSPDSRIVVNIGFLQSANGTGFSTSFPAEPVSADGEVVGEVMASPASVPQLPGGRR